MGSTRNVDYSIFVTTLFNRCGLAGFRSLSEAYKSKDAVIKHVPGLQCSVIG